jgi:hypothetical protein
MACIPLWNRKGQTIGQCTGTAIAMARPLKEEVKIEFEMALIN